MLRATATFLTSLPHTVSAKPQRFGRAVTLSSTKAMSMPRCRLSAGSQKTCQRYYENGDVRRPERQQSNTTAGAVAVYGEVPIVVAIDGDACDEAWSLIESRVLVCS